MSLHPSGVFPVPCTPEAPPEGLRPLVPLVDEAVCRLFDSGYCRETSVLQRYPFQDREPDLDLVAPRRMGRRMEEHEPTCVALVELRPAGLLAVVMDIEIIQDHNDIPGVAVSDFLHELDQICRCSSRAALTEHATGLDLEAADENATSVAAIVKVHPDIAARACWAEPGFTTVREEPLFMDTKNRYIVRWVRIERADRIDLLLKERILAVQPHAHPMRPDTSVSEDSADLAGAQSVIGCSQERCLQRYLRPH